MKTCVSASTNIICKQSVWNCAISDGEAGTSDLQTAGRGAEEQGEEMSEENVARNK